MQNKGLGLGAAGRSRHSFNSGRELLRYDVRAPPGRKFLAGRRRRRLTRHALFVSYKLALKTCSIPWMFYLVHLMILQIHDLKFEV
jgi:hypothetical protein